MTLLDYLNQPAPTWQAILLAIGVAFLMWPRKEKK